MYRKHSAFMEPADEDIKVWRYIDFTKLISLIDTSCLFFARVDKFQDPFEGSWPKINIDNRENLFKQYSEQYLSNHFKNLTRFIAINCWHENEHESAAMWKLYLKSDEGIAIQSTYKLLKKSIIDEETVHIGKIKYIDYETEQIRVNNLFGAFVHKRKSFEHEREIRAVIKKPPILSKEGKYDYEEETISSGLQIKVDIKTLIQKIYVAPNSPSWFLELVGAAVKRYGYSFEVIQSQLNKNPIF